MTENTERAALNDRELLVACFERILADWYRIDGEWGPTDGGLEGAIASGEETLIPKLRAALATGPSHTEVSLRRVAEAGAFALDEYARNLPTLQEPK